MTLKVRRVVTGHDENGRARVIEDKLMDNVVTLRSGNSGCVMWATDTTPAEVNTSEDPATRAMDIEPPQNGSVFRILQVMPGKKPFMHRTDTIDYALVLEGECVMLLDDGEEVALSAGDILIQRGTWHGWANRSDKPCKLAFILIGARKPKELEGRAVQGEHEK
jgi:quercetin dioxygenase-like cupin family protein